ncbi:MAG: mannose-1-phosphate guanylyltransferase [Polyangiaceae bacterium]
MDKLRAVILAGGAGSRFWPASRRLRPKQLLPLGPDPHEPLLLATVRRLAPLVRPERVLISTGAHLIEQTRAVLPELRADQFLSEPLPRNTAPCIGWAAHRIAREREDAIVIVLPADHVIQNEEQFLKALSKAIELAEQGPIVTIGVEPTRAETGFGYIEVGLRLDSTSYKVERFVEKPDLYRAQSFLSSGNFLWNGGMFIFRADVMKRAIRTHLPQLSEALDRIDDAAANGREAEAVAVADEFPSMQGISIDHGVIEKHDELAVVRSSFGWSDVGSWQSAWELAQTDEDDNALSENTLLVDSRRNLVRDLRTDGKKRTIALVGVEDLVVVETDDALLVMPRERAQELRYLVEKLPKDFT